MYDYRVSCAVYGREFRLRQGLQILCSVFPYIAFSLGDHKFDFTFELVYNQIPIFLDICEVDEY